MRDTVYRRQGCTRTVAGTRRCVRASRAVHSVGLLVGRDAISSFDRGDVNRMGPGMFAAGPGCPLAALGVAIAIPAGRRGGTLASIDWRAAAFITLGVLSFALMVVPFGMVPAIMSPTIAGLLADDKIGIHGALAFGAFVSRTAYIFIRLGPRSVLEPIRWPLRCL